MGLEYVGIMNFRLRDNLIEVKNNDKIINIQTICDKLAHMEYPPVNGRDEKQQNDNIGQLILEICAL